MLTLTEAGIVCGGLGMSRAEWAGLRPDIPLPELPGSAVRLWCAPDTGRVMAWDSAGNQLAIAAGAFDLVAATAVVAAFDGGSIAGELEAMRDPLDMERVIDRLRSMRSSRQAVFVWSYGGQDYLIDADDVSLTRITGAVTAARLAQEASESWEIDWTTADDVDVTLSASQMIALGLAAMAHVTAVHYRWRVLRQLIGEAASPEEAWAVDITGGWPGEGE